MVNNLFIRRPVLTIVLSLTLVLAGIISILVLPIAKLPPTDEVASVYPGASAEVVEVLQAQSTLAGARSEQANARAFWYIALVQLAHDIGVVPLAGEPRPAESPIGPPPGPSVGSIDPPPKRS